MERLVPRNEGLRALLRHGALVAFAAQLAISFDAVAQQHPASEYYDFKMLHDSQEPFRWYLDSRQLTPAGLDFNAVETAARNAWQTWDSVTCAATAFSYAGRTSASQTPIPNPGDSHDVFNVAGIWVTSVTDPAYQYVRGGPTLSQRVTYNGVVQTCDVYINAVDYQWSTSDVTPAAAIDLESAFLHEIGHCQGLNHSLQGSDKVMWSDLVPGQKRRMLTDYDIGQLCQRYPASDEIGAPCDGAAGSCGANPALKCALASVPDAGVQRRMCSIGCSPGVNSQCPFPYLCVASTQFSPDFGGACLPPDRAVTPVGSPCEVRDHCLVPQGQCMQERLLNSGNGMLWNDGYCTQSCTQGQNPCPTGSECVPFGAGDSRCLKSCRIGSNDCRAGYACVMPGGTLGGICASRCEGNVDCGAGSQCRLCDGTCLQTQNGAGTISDRCSVDLDCGPGQVCHRFPNSNYRICTQTCSIQCSSCPTGTTCHTFGDGLQFCLKNCSGPGTCGLGTQCAQLKSGMACMGPCLFDAQCPVGSFCSSAEGECRVPTTDDAGCVLCPPGTDGGRPTNGIAPDAGPGGGPGGGGCGCGSVQQSLLALVLLAVAWSCNRRVRSGQR